MKNKFRRLLSASAAIAVTASSSFALPAADYSLEAKAASNVMLEYLDRGITAVNTGKGMLVSWRYLANDDDNAVYKLYRDNTLIYTSEAGKATCYLDAQGSASSKYRVDTLSSSGALVSSENCRLVSGNTYFDIPMSPPTGSGCTYSPNDMSVGDIDGDGQYELFVKWDPSNSQDNSKGGKTGNVFIDCVRLDGTRVWRIDLGVNIRAGAHYTQFYVADFDLDGKAEMTCKTADGTKDGTGKVIGDGSKDYRNGDGYILDGPEYYTLFDGATGAALDTVDYEPARGTVSSWGDKYGNRVDRFWGSVAYVDGVHPCVITGRGYYTRMTATCYGVENKKLIKKWAFDTGNNSSAAGYGDGNHNSMPADVDGDGKQEIITGATCIDDNGKVLWCTNLGHGDAMHLSDFEPDRAGLELFVCHEEQSSGWGVSIIEAASGKTIYHENGTKDTGRCGAANVTAANPGSEYWGPYTNGTINVKGGQVSSTKGAQNFFTYWDGDLEREYLDGGDAKPATISKMNASGKIDTLLTTTGFITNNSTKGNPCLSADLFGDWREELIVRAADNNSVRIYCTPYETDYRITTLMHDAQYRMQVSSQNTAYNQPPHTSFFLGTGYDLPARPTDTVNTNGISANPSKTGAVIDTGYNYKIKNKKSGLYLEVADSKAENGTNVQQGTAGSTVWKFAESSAPGYYYIYSEVGDGKTFLLDVDSAKTENGTNIGIWDNTNSDAQLFKLVDNGDGTYAICTKVTKDASGIGVSGASTEAGANVIEWECNDSDDQKWILEINYNTISGELVKELAVKDMDNSADWKITGNAAVGSLIYGDRDFTYTQLPASLAGAEMIQTACDSKNSANELAEFTAAKDITVSVLLDTRVQESMGAIPEWLNGWTKTSEQAASSNDVVFDIYEKSVKAGEVISLGTNTTSYNVMNYAVLVKENAPAAPVTTVPPTTVPPVTTTTTPVETPTVGIIGDANCDGVVTMADAAAIFQSIGNPDKYALSEQGRKNADVSGGEGVTASDAISIQKLVAGVISSLPEK
ncbi:MAG: RICIN domain-containing protein [Ruminococcus sp.]|nr:RICIN domain-containing protein [Ruminococcus sp.]